MYAMAREAYWWVWFVGGFLFGLFEVFVCVFGFFFVSQRKQLGKRFWSSPAGLSYASLFELFVMFELICPMFKKCGLLKNVDVHEKH